MKIALLAFGVLVASAASGQAQSTTNTNCNVNGQQINCTSTTTTPPDYSAAGAAVGTALGTAIRAAKNKHDAKKAAAAEKAAEQAVAVERAANWPTPESASETDKFRMIHCVQSPGETTTNESGNIISCSDFMVKMKYFCAAAPKYAACAYLPIQPPHEAPVGEASAPLRKETPSITQSANDRGSPSSVIARTTLGASTGEYGGIVHNKTASSSAEFGIVVNDVGGVLTGCMGVRQPLFGSGPLSGRVDGADVSFVVTSAIGKITFVGQRNNGDISGTYTVVRDGSPDQLGNFTLNRAKNDGLPSDFDTANCPTDAEVHK